VTGIYGLPNGLDGDRRFPVVHGHIRPGHMALLGKDPRQDGLQLGLIPLGHDPCREIHMHFFRIGRGAWNRRLWTEDD